MIFRALPAILLILPIISEGGPLSTSPVAEDGVLDASQWNFLANGPIRLRGEWRFVAETLLNETDVEKIRENYPDKIKVPGFWRNNRTDSEKPKSIENSNYGTYMLEIVVNPRLHNQITYGVKLNEAWSAAAVILYDPLHKKKLAHFYQGKPSIHSDTEVPIFISKVRPINNTDSQKLILIIQVSNHHTHRGGIRKPPEFGTIGQLQTAQFREILPSILLIGALLIISIYHLVLFAQRSEDKASLVFFIFCTCVAFREMTTSRILQNLGWGHSISGFLTLQTFQIFSASLAVSSTGYFIQTMVPGKLFLKVCRVWFYGGGIILAITSLVNLGEISGFFYIMAEFYALIAGIMAMIHLVAKSLRKNKMAQWFAASLLLVIAGTVNDILFVHNIIVTGYYAVYSVIGFILLQSTLISGRAAKAFRKARHLSINLKEEVKQQTIALESKTELAIAAKMESENAHREALISKEQSDKAHNEADKLRLKAEGQTERLKEIDREKTTFFQNMSHELRTPLTLILNPLEHASQKYGGDKNIEIARKNARRLLRLVNQLLDFQKLEAGKRKLKLSPIDLIDFCKVCSEYFSTACINKGILFNFSYPQEYSSQSDKSLWVMSEIDALEKIAFNYLSNALKFTKRGGRIDLQLTVEDNRIKMSVSDNGPGISTENQKKLFQVFSQANESSNRMHEGSGLGLALVKSLVDEMDGEVGVVSSSGNGCTFWMKLDMLKNDASLIHVLIVEDDDMIRHSLFRRISTNLDLDDDEIIAKSSVEEALEVIQKHEIACVISDYQLTGKNGLDLMTAISQKSPKTYRILMTAQADFELLERAVNDRLVHQVVHKTGDHNDFMGKIEKNIKENIDTFQHQSPQMPVVDVLILDDDENLLGTLSNLVSEELDLDPNNVVQKKSVNDAVKFLAKNHVRCILSDYNLMGPKTGLHLLEEVTKEYPDTKRILMTAEADLEIMQRAVNQGSVDQVFYKPFSMEELLSTIKSMIEESNIQKEVSTTHFEIKPWLLDENHLSDNESIEKNNTDEDFVSSAEQEVILVVDDITDMRDLIKDYLSSKNYKVITAANGQQGFELVLEKRPDLVITDWMMPIKSGPEMIKEISNYPELASIPTILLSAKSDDESRIIGTEIGADSYLGKPFNQKELISIVRNLLSLKAHERTVKDLNNQLTENILKRFLPPILVDQIIRGDIAIEESPKLLTATILFSDLVGFTDLSNDIRVTKASRILNKYLETMNEVIFNHGSTIDKFMGDSIMVIFGAPVESGPSEQAKKATQCAIAMQAAMHGLNAEWEKENIKKLKMRIGIHQGPVMIGTFGSKRRSDYTAIGPTVNKASRIEGKCEPGQVYISAEVCDFIDEKMATKVGDFNLKGINGLHNLYKLAS